MFYDIYADLCVRKGVSLSKAAEDNGLSRTSVVKWKNGSIPSSATIQKLALYFDVSVNQLLAIEDKKETPPAPARDVSDDDIKFALFNGNDGVTDAMYDEVKAFAEFVKQKHKKG